MTTKYQITYKTLDGTTQVTPPLDSELAATFIQAFTKYPERLAGLRVDRVEEPESRPVEFFKVKPDLAGSCQHCAVCGRKVNPRRCHWVHTNYGTDPIHPDEVEMDDPAYSGAFPIGSECAKLFPPDFLVGPEGMTGPAVNF